MKRRLIILAGILIIALLSGTGTVVALGNSSTTAGDTISGSDQDPTGPGSPLFGLKVAMEDLDETFTFNDTRRVEKQAGHAQARIEEVQRELELGQAGSAEKALGQYLRKLNQTEMSLQHFQSGTPELLQVQELVTRHQSLLADLLSRYPDSNGLTRAYNNNQQLEQKIGEKTRMKFERITDKNNKSVLMAVKLDTGKPDNSGADNSSSGGNSGQGKNETQSQVKDKKNDTSVTPTITSSPPTQSEEKGSLKNQGKNGHS